MGQRKKRHIKTGRAYKVTHARSLRELAALVGRSVSAVSKWVRRPDWPFGGAAPWNAAKVALWARQTLSPNRAAGVLDLPSADDAKLSRLERQARAQVYDNRALLLRQEYERRAGKLHDAQRCQERRLRQIHAVKTALLDLPRMATDLDGRDRHEIERLLATRVDGILHAFAGEA